MVAQVELLCDGALDNPMETINLPARKCGWEIIKEDIQRKRKHPWDVLPGKAAAAFKRVQVRPDHFVSLLNPKVQDPWTMSDLVRRCHPLGRAKLSSMFPGAPSILLWIGSHHR